jgi:TRAP-type C4-dicarboxylate transport system permease small subunit
MIGMIGGLAAIIWVKQSTRVAFTWYVLIGTAATFLIGCLSSVLLRERTARDALAQQ